MKFTIKRTTRDVVVVRVGGEYEQHAHFKKYSGARKIIELIQHGKMPTKKYFIIAAKRLLTEEEFEQLQGTKKPKYYNRGGRKVV